MGCLFPGPVRLPRIVRPLSDTEITRLDVWLWDLDFVDSFCLSQPLFRGADSPCLHYLRGHESWRNSHSRSCNQRCCPGELSSLSGSNECTLTSCRFHGFLHLLHPDPQNRSSHTGASRPGSVRASERKFIELSDWPCAGCMRSVQVQ